MKQILLLIGITVTLAGQAQKTYAIYEVIDPVKGGYNWSAIKDMSKSSNSGFIMDNRTAAGNIIDAKLQTKKGEFSPGLANNISKQPMFSNVAALAFDQLHNRLYYTTMFTQQLRYINLGKHQSSQYFDAGNIHEMLKTKTTTTLPNHSNQGGVITRMTIGADGKGYGISNDGNTFFSFSLDSKTSFEELGSLIDDESNGSISVHNKSTSWGGDIVGAANGDLYLFSIAQNVFKINPKTKVATYLGKIKGLDATFAVNGAAVTDDGKVIISTATVANSRAEIQDMETLNAIEKKDNSYNAASDLASANLLFANQKTKQTIALNMLAAAKNISVYPNPLLDGKAVIVQFEKMPAGRFVIDVLNASGGTVQRKTVEINADGQQITLNKTKFSKGLYIVKATESNTGKVFNSKLIVQ